MILGEKIALGFGIIFIIYFSYNHIKKIRLQTLFNNLNEPFKKLKTKEIKGD